MKQITHEEILLSVKLFKWIYPRVNPASQIWNKGDEIYPNWIYRYDVNGKTQAIWMDYDNVQEIHFIRIFKKKDLLPHEFFLYSTGKKIRVGWRVKK